LKHREGIVLFAHGSREPQWARPFEQLAALVAKKSGAVVKLAYLEQMTPTLDQAIAALVAEGLARVRVVPVFLGQGGHVREDLPKLVNAAAQRHPRVSFAVDAPIGEQAAVIDGIASVIAANKN
jgi:sirohydrochlorin cobaltochelatase